MPLSQLPTTRAFIKLHVSILLAGFTGILGKLISLNEGLLVWYRMLFTFSLFWVFLFFRKRLERVLFKDMCKMGFTGALLAAHWIFFYGSIKLSNVSIGVICFSSVGFFTAMLEPLILRHRISIREVAFSMLTILGICLIFSFDIRYRWGIIAGIIAALLCALYTISVRRLCKNYNVTTTLLYQMIGGWLFVSLLIPLYIVAYPTQSLLPSLNDIILLLCLAVFCTIIMNILLIEALRLISAFTVNLSYNLEPVYSIVIAIAFLGEAQELQWSFYTGLACIAASVALQTWWVMRKA